MAGIDLIAAERKRQIEEEGWTATHDDKHFDQSLAQAAAYYAWPFEKIEPTLAQASIGVGWLFPSSWHPEWDKKLAKDRKRQLVVAGALIAAEIDRLERLEAAEQ